MVLLPSNDLIKEEKNSSQVYSAAWVLANFRCSQADNHNKQKMHKMGLDYSATPEKMAAVKGQVNLHEVVIDKDEIMWESVKMGTTINWNNTKCSFTLTGSKNDNQNLKNNLMASWYKY